MGLGVFLATQSVLWVIQSNRISLIGNRLIFGEKDDLLAGDIFFTGDTSGQFDPVGCDRLGSLSRRSYLLKKFDQYLYLDCGNFTHDNPRRQSVWAAPGILFLKEKNYEKSLNNDYGAVLRFALIWG